jgi:ATP synthase F1 delta subunit
LNQVETILATRYAQAFFDIFQAYLSDDVIMRIDEVIALLQNDKRTFCIQAIPQYLVHDACKVLNTLLIDAAELPDVFKKLIVLLVRDRRTFLIRAVLKQIVRIYYQKKQIYKFCITSSHALNESQLESIEKFIAYQLHSTIIFTYRIDSSLIAGIRLHSAIHLWEYSVRKNLDTLYNTVMNKVRYW